MTPELRWCLKLFLIYLLTLAAMLAFLFLGQLRVTFFEWDPVDRWSFLIIGFVLALVPMSIEGGIE